MAAWFRPFRRSGLRHLPEAAASAPRRTKLLIGGKDHATFFPDQIPFGECGSGLGRRNIMEIRYALVAAVAAVVGATAVQAQDLAVGEQIYLDRCAACHGAAGAGDGLAAVLFANAPRNLRLLSQENGGEFPLDMVLQSIDGRLVLPAHGGANPMPIWGEAFMVEALGDRMIDPKDSAMIVQGRLLSVARYIESLQVQ